MAPCSWSMFIWKLRKKFNLNCTKFDILITFWPSFYQIRPPINSIYIIANDFSATELLRKISPNQSPVHVEPAKPKLNKYGKPMKTVRFKADQYLESVRYFEVDENERGNKVPGKLNFLPHLLAPFMLWLFLWFVFNALQAFMGPTWDISLNISSVDTVDKTPPAPKNRKKASCSIIFSIIWLFYGLFLMSYKLVWDQSEIFR